MLLAFHVTLNDVHLPNTLKRSLQAEQAAYKSEQQWPYIQGEDEKIPEAGTLRPQDR